MDAGVGTLSLARISITRSPTPADLEPMNIGEDSTRWITTKLTNTKTNIATVTTSMMTVIGSANSVETQGCRAIVRASSAAITRWNSRQSSRVFANVYPSGRGTIARSTNYHSAGIG